MAERNNTGLTPDQRMALADIMNLLGEVMEEVRELYGDDPELEDGEVVLG